MREFGGWVSADTGLYSARDVLLWGRKRFMVVERLPGGGWDWAAWTSDGVGRSVYGQAESLIVAITAAEGAAERLAEGEPASITDPSITDPSITDPSITDQRVESSRLNCGERIAN